MFDQLDTGQRIKILNVVDEYTREHLASYVAKSITTVDVISVIDNLITQRGAPVFIRSDNGPEFVSRQLQKWLKARGTETAFVNPGSPWENAYIETFNGKMRDELLNMDLCLHPGSTGPS